MLIRSLSTRAKRTLNIIEKAQLLCAFLHMLIKIIALTVQYVILLSRIVVSATNKLILHFSATDVKFGMANGDKGE
ncbi:hypothetical protein CHH51_05585 [Terribacillus saccharophilus]|nr:hypothetical protein CHH51_05585 [Terribacillus saccharophilus]